MKKTESGIELGMMKVFLSMLFSKLDIDRWWYCQKEGDSVNFDKLVDYIEMLRAWDKSMTSNKIT